MISWVAHSQDLNPSQSPFRPACRKARGEGQRPPAASSQTRLYLRGVEQCERAGACVKKKVRVRARVCLPRRDLAAATKEEAPCGWFLHVCSDMETGALLPFKKFTALRIKRGNKLRARCCEWDDPPSICMMTSPTRTLPLFSAAPPGSRESMINFPFCCTKQIPMPASSSSWSSTSCPDPDPADDVSYVTLRKLDILAVGAE
jgi:hypothetical protein